MNKIVLSLSLCCSCVSMISFYCLECSYGWVKANNMRINGRSGIKVLLIMTYVYVCMYIVGLVLCFTCFIFLILFHVKLWNSFSRGLGDVKISWNRTSEGSSSKEFIKKQKGDCQSGAQLSPPQPFVSIFPYRCLEITARCRLTCPLLQLASHESLSKNQSIEILLI